MLVVSAAAIVLLRQGIYAPFGYTLRAARDSGVRADAIGIDVRTHRWLAFTIAGAAAGLAGGLFAFSKGSIDPTLISIPMSVDFLVMTLLGGVQTVIGPLVGAAAFHSIRDFVMPLTDYWRAAAGPCHHRHRAGLPARHRRRRDGPAIAARLRCGPGRARRAAA